MDIPGSEIANYALECKLHWCTKILDGIKTIEVRQYALSSELIGCPILLVATTGTGEGLASLGARTKAGNGMGQVVGWVKFSGYAQYDSNESFANDAARHLVSTEASSPYAWQGSSLFGWKIDEYARFPEPRPLPAMERMQRSIHRIL